MSDAIRDQLDAIQARADEATPGPWEADLDPHETRGIWPTTPSEEIIIGAYTAADGFDSQCYNLGSDDDLTFIAHAREDVPRMVAALRAVLDLHILQDWRHPDDPIRACVECNQSDREGLDPAPWPCPTVEAIRAAIEASDE